MFFYSFMRNSGMLCSSAWKKRLKEQCNLPRLTTQQKPPKKVENATLDEIRLSSTPPGGGLGRGGGGLVGFCKSLCLPCL